MSVANPGFVATQLHRLAAVAAGAALLLVLRAGAPHASFKDPFNEVRGQDGIRQIFAHMFTIVDVPRFIVTEQLVQGQRAFLAWEFHFRMRR
ncbi:nuclear transport factor 2 family protein [Alcaligenes sp. CHO6]|uniref:nuclear transport factor 2 family protein n=1 Tax=Alcaligenes sp. CHO6 TaxID=3123298 RepID=UPI003014D111